jgi:hypothetical protein
MMISKIEDFNILKINFFQSRCLIFQIFNFPIFKLFTI